VAAAVSDMKAFVTGSLAAGVSLVVIVPIVPRNVPVASGTQMQAINDYNRIMAAFASTTVGCKFLDVVPQLLNPTSTTYAPVGTAIGAAGAVTIDGIHPSSVGARITAALYTTLLSALTGTKQPRAINPADTYSAATNPRGNILGGTIGTAQGTNGFLNSVANAGIPASWYITSANGVVIVPSIVAGTANKFLPAGYNMLRLTLSGTTTADTNITVAIFIAGLATLIANNESLTTEAIVRLVNPVGLAGVQSQLYLNSAAASPVFFTHGGLGTGVAADDLPTVDETLFLASPTSAKVNSTLNGSGYAAVVLRFRTGQVLSGSIDIGCMGVFSTKA
jgi:hypothetical protein